jgi:pimeloyl-ACP methyl ester carboxylesterase
LVSLAIFQLKLVPVIDKSIGEQIIFIHGLEGSSQGVKASLLRGLFPGILTPDFSGSLEQRMAQLNDVLGGLRNWTMIGSSLGGLMAATFTVQHPEQVKRLVLLAPALIWPDFAASSPAPVTVPTIIYHGKQDTVVPLAPVRELAKRVFRELKFYAVDDDHGLYKTVHAIDWPALLEVQPRHSSES